MSAFSEHFYTAPDGIKTYYRKYPAAGMTEKRPVICIHGLTRNSRDFEEVAPEIAALGRSVVAVDVRGRGQSDRDPKKKNYEIPVYASDMAGLMDELGWQNAISLGTSMGGLITMAMAPSRPELFSAVILNDIGPELAPEGLARIQSYVGGSPVFDDWHEAAAAMKAVNSEAFPHKQGDAFWIAFARRTCRERPDGKIVPDYDPAIGEAVKQGNAAPPDMWPLFDSLSRMRLLVIRGEISDLLSAGTVAKMKDRHPDCRAVEIPGVGHAPLLTEPEAQTALAEFFAECE